VTDKPSRRTLALLLAAALAAGGVLWFVARKPTATAPSPPPRAGSDLAGFFATFAAGLRESDPYRPPTDAERATAVTGLRTLFDGADRIDAARAALEPLGFAVSTGTDTATGRRYAMAVSERGSDRAWGAYVIDLSAPARLVIQVPHPNFDLGTEEIGVALFRRAPGSVLLVAGAHRKAADGAGDVAHRDDSLFHAASADLAERDLPQVQLHGFHDRSLPGKDVVVSAGAGDPGPEVKRAASALADRGLDVCRAWRDDCGKLSGTRNVQGRAAADRGTVFLHVEISRRVRDDEKRWSRLVRALAAAFPRDAG